MKNKLNYLLLIVFLFLPFIVKASDTDIQIESIELVEKVGKTQELKPAEFKDLKVWVNLKFFEVNDSAKYKVVVKNVSNDEYVFNAEHQDFSKEKYISYKYELENDVISLKPGDKSNMYITISYDIDVDSNDYVENLYINDNYMNLSFDKVSVKEEIKEDVPEEKEEVKNPETSVSKIVITSLIVCVISFVLIVVSLKNKKVLYGIIGVMLLIPAISRAAELFKIDINAHIEIEKKVEIGEFYLCFLDNVYQFEIGMDFEEWINSEYNTSDSVFREEIFEMDGQYVYHDYKTGCFDPYFKSCTYNQVGYGSIIEDGHQYYCEGVAECVSPYSKVMISLSGNTKLAKDIKENDDIVYYDFVTKKMKVGKVKKSYVHKDATQFVRYTLEDGTYLEATDYHPIYTLDGWKSYTNRNGYESPVVGDRVKTNEGYVKITKIETYTGREDFVDFKVVSKDGVIVDNYYANGMLVHSAY